MCKTLAVLCVSWLAAASLTGCRRSPAPPEQTPSPAATAAAPAPAAPTAPKESGKVAGRVEVAVTEEGFVPSRIPAKLGTPITLVITRKTEKTCATEILFKGQEGKTDLPLNKPVEVTYTPKASGEIKFGCGMGMMIAGVLAVAE